jgi:hypothetical protein
VTTSEAATERDGVSGRRTLVVTLRSADRSKTVDLESFGRQVAEAIGRRERDGWRLVSSDVITLRKTGTFATLFTGGEFVTQLGAILVFQRDD